MQPYKVEQDVFSKSLLPVNTKIALQMETLDERQNGTQKKPDKMFNNDHLIEFKKSRNKVQPHAGIPRSSPRNPQLPSKTIHVFFYYSALFF